MQRTKTEDLTVRTIIGGKQFIQSDGQHVDGEWVFQLAAQVESVAHAQHGVVIAEVVNATEQFTDENHIIEGDGHARAGQRVTHVQRVTKAHDATPVQRRRSEEVVGHAANLATVYSR